MTRAYSVLPGLGLAAVVLLLFGAAPPADVDALLREAGAAYRNQDYARAAELLEQAEDRATDPGMVALNRAAALVRLALADGNAAALTEAEQLYRCCTSVGDPRRPQALLGLGNCLLWKSGDPDLATVRLAIDTFEQCLREAATDAVLASDARHNLERARLLALQIQTSKRSAEEPPAGSDRPPDGPPPDHMQNTLNPTRDLSSDRPDPRAGIGPRRPDRDQTPRGTDETSPGKGNLPPIADQTDPAPLSVKDAAEHLEQAARRIADELLMHRQRSARPPAPGVRDW
jgi:tetratricopeptide (TPR) repeat protein